MDMTFLAGRILCEGKRYIAYARCAYPGGADEKLEEQIRNIRRFADSVGMICAGEVRLAGVSGVTPVLREDLRALLTRKRERNDFSFLVTRDHARLSRAQTLRGCEVEYAFGCSGVSIIYLSHLRNWE